MSLLFRLHTPFLSSIMKLHNLLEVPDYVKWWFPEPWFSGLENETRNADVPKMFQKWPIMI